MTESNISNKFPWWTEEYGFFGMFYMEGDNSKEGYLDIKKQDLTERTSTEVNGIIRLLSLSKHAEILDCPCGYGRHSIELAKRGFNVTGSELNSIHLNMAKKEAKKEKLVIKFVKENMMDLNYNDQFDAVINMFYSFGFFDTDKENEKVLINFLNALKKNGKLIMHTDVNIPRIISGKYKGDEQRSLASGKTLRILDKYDPIARRINGSWIITDKSGKETRKDYSVRVYAKDEFISLCKKIGFRNCVAYSDWNGKKYSEYSEDMIIVATK